MHDLTIFKAALLGLIQGLGEFLPISSSGHLMLAQHYLGLPDIEKMKAFDVLLHLATLVALVAYFRDDLQRTWGAFFRRLKNAAPRGEGEAIDARWAGLVLVSMVPTGILALGLGKHFDRVFEAHEWLVGAMLLVAGTFNYYSAKVIASGVTRRRIEQLGVGDSLICGALQGLAAVFHGISRSGSTIAAGLACGLDADSAPRFSFLMATPAIACAALVEVPKLLKHGAGGPPPFMSMAVGFVIAAAVGYWALGTVFTAVRQGKLDRFAYYCWAVGAIAFLALATGH